MQRILCLLACALCSMVATAQAQGRLEALAGNYHSSLPLVGAPGLFYKTVHPGLQVGYEHTLRQAGRRQWLLRAQAGVFYHRFIQTAVPLTAQGVLQWAPSRKPDARLRLEAGLGLGYCHSFPLTAVFKLQDNGTYARTERAGRPLVTFSLAPGLAYRLDAADRWRLALRYQIMLQAPFVPQYVPMLPYNSLQLGLSYRLGLASALPSTPAQ